MFDAPPGHDSARAGLTRGPPPRPQVALPSRGGSRPAADLVDHAVREIDDIEVAIGPLLDIRRRAETRADLECLALRAVELVFPEEVGGDVVGQPRVGADVDMQAVGREVEAIEAAA